MNLRDSIVLERVCKTPSERSPRRGLKPTTLSTPDDTTRSRALVRIAFFEVALASVFFLLPGCVFANTPCSSSNQVFADPATGILVEKVTRGSAGEKSGLRERDVITGWSRPSQRAKPARAGDLGEPHGEIASTFALSWIEEEQQPRGQVTLEGLRSGQKQTWVMPAEDWGIQARPSLPGDLLCQYQDGQKLAETSKLFEAASVWKNGAAQAHAAHSPLLALWFLLKAARLLAAAEHWQEAREAYQECVQQAQSSGQPGIAARILRDQADAFDNLSLDEEEKCYLQALNVMQALPEEKLSAAIILGKLASLARTKGNLALAKDYREQALATQQKIAPESLAVAGSLNTLGIIAKEEGDFAKAQADLRRALQIKQKIAPDSRAVLSTLNNLAGVLEDEGDLAQAEQYFRMAQALAEKLGIVMGALFLNLGGLAEDRGDFAQAEEYYLRYLEICRKVDPHGIGVGMALNNLGNLALDGGDAGKAEKYLRQALEVYERIAPGSLEVAETLGNLGLAAHQRRDFEEAEAYLTQSLTIQTKKSPNALATARTNEFLGDLYRDQGDLTKSERFYRQALEMRETVAPYSTDQAETLAALGGILRRQAKPDGAAQLFEQALHALEIQLTRFGGTEDLRSSFRAKHLTYYKNYIDLLLEQHQPALAFEVLERSRARSLLWMLTAAHVDIHQGVDPALLQKERSARAAIRAKTNRRIELLNGKHDEARIAALNQEIDKLLAQHNDVVERIRLSSPGYAALAQPRPLTTKETQQMLDSETVLLEYALGEEQNHIFVLTSESVNSYELPKGLKIEQAARRVYELLTARNRKVRNETDTQRDRRLRIAAATYPQAATELSQMILPPAAVQPGKKRLLIVADGVLQYIPFSLLPTPPAWSMAGEDSLAMATPLVARYEIVSLPSASTLAALRQQIARGISATRAIAILADPVFTADDVRVTQRGKALANAGTGTVSGNASVEDSSAERLTRSLNDVGLSGNGELRLPRLPFTQQEAKAIAATASAGEVLRATDFKANRETAVSQELAQYRIIHFATHGLLDTSHPELSGLVLSMVNQRGERQNGYLTLEDIYNLKLPAELVVLSACETGLGKEVDGEGLVGLTRGFMYAGASRVVASLWKVDDAASAELMKRFYQGMEEEGLRPAAALRRAQLDMLRQERWHSPYYWAAFQLQGEWK